jgi:hypothetical protein
MWPAVRNGLAPSDAAIEPVVRFHRCYAVFRASQEFRHRAIRSGNLMLET